MGWIGMLMKFSMQQHAGGEGMPVTRLMRDWGDCSDEKWWGDVDKGLIEIRSEDWRRRWKLSQ